MASETELDRMVIRLTGDATSYHRMTEQAQADTRKMETSVGSSLGKVSHGMHGSLRAVHMLVHGFHTLLNAKGPEQIATSVGHMALGIGHRFGMTGMMIGAAVSIVTAAAVKMNHEFRNIGLESANLAFKGMVDGAKSAREALAEVGLDQLKKDIVEIQHIGNEPDIFSKLWGNAKVFYQEAKKHHGPIDTMKDLLTTPPDVTRKKAKDTLFEEALKNQTNSVKEFNKALQDPKNREMLNELRTLMQAAPIAKIEDEMDLRQVTIGATKEQIKYEKIRQELLKHPSKGTDKLLGKLWEARVREATIAIDEFENSLKEAAETEGMLGDEKKLREMEKWIDLTTNGQKATLQQTILTNALSEEIKLFNEEMAGATKAELARARASGEVSKAVAYQKTLMSEALRVHQEFQTPAEKFNATHKEMSELLKEGKIDTDLYSKAMAKAAQELNGVREAMQGVGVGSAEAFGKLLAYQDTLNITKNIPKPVPLGDASAVGSAGAVASQQANRTLQMILNELMAANKKPAIQINAAGLGGNE